MNAERVHKFVKAMNDSESKNNMAFLETLMHCGIRPDELPIPEADPETNGWVWTLPFGILRENEFHHMTFEEVPPVDGPKVDDTREEQ